MKKQGVIFLFISLLVISSFVFNNNYVVSDLIFVLDPDNYDILEFISLDNNLIYVIFIIASLLLLISFGFLKNHLHKLFIKSEIYRQINVTNKLRVRSPPY